jgi:glycosyltransferase 2 family protein
VQIVHTPRFGLLRSPSLMGARKALAPRLTRARQALGPKVRRTIKVALLLVVGGLLGVVVVNQWSGVARVIGSESVASLAGSTALALAGTWCSFLCWRALSADLGGAVPLVGAMRIFFVGQLGKYVPGKVWPVVAQVRLGRRHGVPGRISAAAAAIVTLLTFGVGLLVTALTLPLLGGDALRRYWWALLVLPVAVVLLLPPVLNRVLERILRLLRRESMPRPLTPGGTGRAVAWAVVTWLCYGAHLLVLLTGAGVPLTPGLVVRSTGAFAASWAIGFLLAFAPAGLGVREIGLVGLLAATVAQPLAVAATLISRLMLTLADLVWPAVALLAERWSPAAQNRPQRTEDQVPAGSAPSAASLAELP